MHKIRVFFELVHEPGGRKFDQRRRAEIHRGENSMPQKKDQEKRVFTGVYFDRPQHDALRQLSTTTRVPLAVYLREAVDDLLKKYGVKTAGPKGRR